MRKSLPEVIEQDVSVSDIITTWRIYMFSYLRASSDPFSYPLWCTQPAIKILLKDVGCLLG